MPVVKTLDLLEAEDIAAHGKEEVRAAYLIEGDNGEQLFLVYDYRADARGDVREFLSLLGIAPTSIGRRER